MRILFEGSGGLWWTLEIILEEVEEEATTLAQRRMQTNHGAAHELTVGTDDGSRIDRVVLTRDNGDILPLVFAQVFVLADVNIDALR